MSLSWAARFDRSNTLYCQATTIYLADWVNSINVVGAGYSLFLLDPCATIYYALRAVDQNFVGPPIWTIQERAGAKGQGSPSTHSPGKQIGQRIWVKEFKIGPKLHSETAKT